MERGRGLVLEERPVGRGVAGRAHVEDPRPISGEGGGVEAGVRHSRSPRRHREEALPRGATEALPGEGGGRHGDEPARAVGLGHLPVRRPAPPAGQEPDAPEGGRPDARGGDPPGCRADRAPGSARRMAHGVPRTRAALQPPKPREVERVTRGRSRRGASGT